MENQLMAARNRELAYDRLMSQFHFN